MIKVLHILHEMIKVLHIFTCTVLFTFLCDLAQNIKND